MAKYDVVPYPLVRLDGGQRVVLLDDQVIWAGPTGVYAMERTSDWQARIEGGTAGEEVTLSLVDDLDQAELVREFLGEVFRG